MPLPQRRVFLKQAHLALCQKTSQIQRWHRYSGGKDNGSIVVTGLAPVMLPPTSANACRNSLESLGSSLSCFLTTLSLPPLYLCHNGV